jgi:hypothetical protein
LDQPKLDSRFEQFFVNHFVRDTDFARVVANDFSPELCTSEYAQRVIRLSKEFLLKEKTAPDKLIFNYLDEVSKRAPVSEGTVKAVTVYLEELFKIPLQNKDYLLERFDDFLQQQRFKALQPLAAQHAKEGNYSKVKELMKDFINYRKKKADGVGRFYDADVESRIARREETDERRLAWLVPPMDATIKGPGPGELIVFLSQRSSIGKSAALIYFARNFAIQGKKVLFLSLEMSIEEVEDRLDQCIAGLVQAELSNAELIQNKLHWFLQFGGLIHLARFPEKITSVQELRDYSDTLRNTENFDADVVIVDYGDQLRADNSYDNMYMGGKEVYHALRTWAFQDEMSLITASQGGKAAIEATVTDQQHMAESIGKVYIADLIMSINRNAQEEKEGLTRLFQVKDRRSKARFQLTFKTDMDRMQFYKPER